MIAADDEFSTTAKVLLVLVPAFVLGQELAAAIGGDAVAETFLNTVAEFA